MTPADLVLRDVELIVDGATLRGRVQLADRERVYVQVWCGGCDRDGCGNAHAAWFSREPHEVTVVDLTTVAPPPPASEVSPASP